MFEKVKRKEGSNLKSVIDGVELTSNVDKFEKFDSKHIKTSDLNDIDRKWEKTLYLSKNNDKIEKKPYKIRPETARAMENLTNHTNNLFFYKTKMNNKMNPSADENDYLNSKSNFVKKAKQMELLVKKFDRITESVKRGDEDKGGFNAAMHDKLYTNIDFLLKKLET